MSHPFWEDLYEQQTICPARARCRSGGLLITVALAVPASAQNRWCPAARSWRAGKPVQDAEVLLSLAGRAWRRQAEDRCQGRFFRIGMRRRLSVKASKGPLSASLARKFHVGIGIRV
jgi:hypothetical protein